MPETRMTLDYLNNSLLSAADHLYEAGLYLSNIPIFRAEAGELMMKSKLILDAIVLPEPKISEDKMESILDEIIGDDDGTGI